MTGPERGPDNQKTWTEESLELGDWHKLCLMSDKLIKKCSSFYLFPRGNEAEPVETFIQCDEVNSRRIKQSRTRGTQAISRTSQTEHTVVLGLITSVSLERKTQVPKKWIFNSFEPLASATN